MYRIFYTILLSFSLLETLWAHKTVCYWDVSLSYQQDEFGVTKFRESLRQCDNLIVGFLGLNASDFRISALKSHQRTKFREVTSSKRDGMKVFLGIGPSVFHNWNIDTYNFLLEREGLRNELVETVTRLAVELDMDGIDLSWPFFPNRDFESVEEPIELSLTSACRELLAKLRRTRHKELGVSKCLGKEGYGNEIRDAFTNFTLSLSASLENVTKDLSLTVLPRTSVDYYDVPKIVSVLKTINLLTFDYVTPLMQPKLADYTAPLYDSKPGANDSVNATIRSWEDAGTPTDKIIMGIPTFVRSWRIIGYAGFDNPQSPPLVAEPPIEGLGVPLSGFIWGLNLYNYACRLKEPLVSAIGSDNTTTATENYYSDTKTHRGSYQYWKRNSPFSTPWSTYDDKQIIAAKVQYVKERGLAGVGIYDLSFDDASDQCKDGSVLSNARTSLVSSSR